MTNLLSFSSLIFKNNKTEILCIFLKDKGGGIQHCLIPFVGSNLGVEIFLKKTEHQKRMRYNRGLMHLSILCIDVSRKF